MLCLRPAALVSTATGATSLPVPAVVPTQTTGSGAFGQAYPYNPASVISGFDAKTATALAASSAEPPPMPIMRSAPSLAASRPASKQHATVGFCVTPSNSVNRTPCASSAAVTSASAPLWRAAVLPVTIKQREPSAHSASPAAATQPAPTRSSVGTKNRISIILYPISFRTNGIRRSSQMMIWPQIKHASSHTKHDGSVVRTGCKRVKMPSSVSRRSFSMR